MAVTGEYGYSPGYNLIGSGNVYTETGDTLGLMSGVGDMSAMAGGSLSGTPPGQQTVANPFQGNFVIGLVVMLGLVFFLGFMIHRFGEPKEDFRNLKASLYNVFIIALVAVTGIPLVKFGFLKLASYNIPLMDHVSAYVMAA